MLLRQDFDTAAPVNLPDLFLLQPQTPPWRPGRSHTGSSTRWTVILRQRVPIKRVWVKFRRSQQAILEIIVTCYSTTGLDVKQELTITSPADNSIRIRHRFPLTQVSPRSTTLYDGTSDIDSGVKSGIGSHSPHELPSRAGNAGIILQKQI